ncbi:DNA polymerase III subunit beta [Chloroflexota bacterium]
MKLSCLQENLTKGLGIVGRAVATRTTLPVTGNVLLVSDQSRLKLVATNLEIAISYWLGAKVEEEGAITVPARLLIDFVNSLPPDRIDINLMPKTRTLELKCARFEGRINGVEADEFPPIPTIGEGPTAEIDAEALRLAITQVAFAAATEETRPVLTGVHSQLDGAKLTMAAADGFRLAVHEARLASPVAEKIEMIIPARALMELHRLIADEKELIGITVNPARSQVVFRLRNAELVSQLIQGTFPDYTQLIPQSLNTRAEVSLADFSKATRTASIFAREGSAIVRLQIIPGEELAVGKIVISARAEEVGDNVGEIDATVEGEVAQIAFNSKYLSDVLGVLREERVALGVTSSSSPGVLRPVGVDNYVHVVMPMFVQW